MSYMEFWSRNQPWANKNPLKAPLMSKQNLPAAFTIRRGWQNVIAAWSEVTLSSDKQGFSEFGQAQRN